MSDPTKNKTDVLINLFEEAKKFTSELLGENERLRLLLAAQKAEGKAGATKMGYHDELKELKKTIADLEAENKDFAGKFVKVEQMNQNMASLYVSSYRLHSTLDFKEVIEIIKEIVINLIGSEVFGIFLKDQERNDLKIIAQEGMEGVKVPPIQIGNGLVGKSAETGESFVTDKQNEGDASNPLACIPLKVQNELLGMIVIYRLLRQKDGFAPMDLDLFSLLADHAATAIYCCQLHHQSERKLSTMQSLLDLLKM